MLFRRGRPVSAAAQEFASIPPTVAKRAVEWLVRLQSEPLVEETREEWARWRAAHPDHERAWQRIETVNGKLRGIASPVQSALAHATLAPVASPGRREAVKALAALIFVGGAVMALEVHTPWRRWSADHRTAKGERRTLTLSDGSALTLNTDSAVDIRFDAAARRVALLSGEILVATASAAGPAAPPFVVETAQGIALPLGTRFSVRQLDDSTAVSVFEGAVEIRPQRAASLRLAAGEQAQFTAQTAGRPNPVSVDDVAWADGFLIARGMRLDDFIAELDRYSASALECAPAVAQLRVSGSYPLQDIDALLDTLVVTLKLRRIDVTRFWGRRIVRIEPV